MTRTETDGEETYSLTEEQAFCLADPDNAIFAPGGFLFALGALKGEERVAEAIRTGTGIGWHEGDEDMLVGCEQFFRPGYHANLTTSWIPALSGVEAQAAGRRARRRHRLRAGRLQRDHGAGLPGVPDRRLGLRRRVDRAGPQARGRRRRRRPGHLRGGQRPDLRRHPATTWSPRSTACTTWVTRCRRARHVREALAPDGSWMIVEPFAQDDPSDNINPVGRVYYNFSTLVCLPNAKSQSGGYALGAQAGEAAIRRVVTDAGFTRFARVAETPVQPRLRGPSVAGPSRGPGHRSPWCPGPLGRRVRACVRWNRRSPGPSSATASASPTRCSGTASGPSSSSRSTRSSSPAPGRRRCPGSPAGRGSSRSTPGATAGPTGRPTRRRTASRTTSPTRSR